MKSPSPLLGFNNNVRHKGRVFHIQTEDSGIKHPHIITHLFADGGRILKTTKTSYAEHVGAATMAETVRAMMQEQHKAMFIGLRDGQFDHLIDPTADRPSSPATGAHATLPKAAASAPTTAPRTAPPPTGAAPRTAPPPPAPLTEPSPQAEPIAGKTPAPQRTSARPAINIDTDSLLGSPKRSASPMGSAVTARTGSAALPGSADSANSPGGPGSASIDLDALERAAEEAQTPFFQQIQDLPPPPASVLAQKPSSAPSTGSYRSATPQPASASHLHSSPPPPQDQPSSGATGRYAQSRPASIFATTRPAEGMSIFGEDLISEKSLDEVILSYLAEDLDSTPDKK